MQKIVTQLLLIAIFSACQPAVEETTFQSQKVSKTASFSVKANIDRVFPLFGAFEERKWETGWDPELIYPGEEVIQEGTAFRTKGHGSEPEYLWVVTQYEPRAHHIQYLVSTDNRFWTISVDSRQGKTPSTTDVTVTYAFTSLTPKGNDLNTASLERMYRHNLQDWALALNNYLEQSKI